MSNADESRPKIAAVWEGTTARMFLIVQLLRLLRFHPLYCSSQVAQPPAHPPWQRAPQESGLLATNWSERSKKREQNLPVCVHLVWEKVSVDQSQRRDQNLGITCLEINNRTVKQCQCLWTGNLVSKQDFVKAIRRQPLVVLKIWRQPPVVLPLQKWKDRGLCR